MLSDLFLAVDPQVVSAYGSVHLGARVLHGEGAVVVGWRQGLCPSRGLQGGDPALPHSCGHQGTLGTGREGYTRGQRKSKQNKTESVGGLQRSSSCAKKVSKKTLDTTEQYVTELNPSAYQNALV